MSNHGMQWLDKLDDLVDRAFVKDENGASDDSSTSEENLDESSGGAIGPRAFSRNVGAACPIHADIGKLRSKLHIPPLSPKRTDDRVTSSSDREGEFDNFVAEAPSSKGVPANDGSTPVVPPILLHDSILDRPEESSGASERDSVPAPPFFPECESKKNTKDQLASSDSDQEVSPVLPVESRRDQSTRSIDVTETVSQLDVISSTTLENQKSGEVTQETEESPRTAQVEDDTSTQSDSSAVIRDQTLSTLSPTVQERVLSQLPSPIEESEEDEPVSRSRSETGDWSDRSIEISVTHSLIDDETEDFQVDFPLSSWDEEIETPFDPSWNCHGVVHVRLLRAQRLPCSIGSNIYATVALPPWKGKIRTERTNAYRGPLECGVCIRWDQLDEAGCSSMVHSWNNDDTPVPTITVDLMFSPLQMMDFTIGSLSLSCEVLMRSPGTWRKQWLPMDIAGKDPVNEDTAAVEDTAPLILLEATFVPSIFKEEEELSLADEVDATGSIRNDDVMPATNINNCFPDSPKRARSGSKEVSVMSKSTQLTLSAPKKFHHFRVHSFWTPATCAVCSSVVTGWKRGYRCEECSVDCCTNCQLQVDLQIPCGSGVAKAAVENAIQNKFDANKLLTMVAPMDPSVEARKSIDDLPTFANPSIKMKSLSLHETDRIDAGDTSKEGIAWLRLTVVRACLFDRHLPPDSPPNEIFNEDEARPLRKGDHYVRISWTGSNHSTRTRTIQNTGKPRFDSGEMNFLVPHYGMEYRIELIDANTDRPVGTTLLTTQGLIHWQRDLLIEERGLAAGVLQWNQGAEKRRTLLELRYGVKSGFATDFFTPSSKVKDSVTKSSTKTMAGEVSGWIEVDVCLEEDTKRLYGPEPYACPPAPPENLNVDMFQIHVARIGALVKDLKGMFDSYIFLVSWKDPILTGVSLIIFMSLCIRFNAEYIGSLPVFFLILYMLRLASIRRHGDLKRRFTKKEKDIRVEAEQKVALKYNVHRPIGRIELDVCRGKNIKSRDLGLTGSVGCRIFWDPVRFLDAKSKQTSASYDLSSVKVHDIAFTSHKYSQHPVWDEVNESDECRRLKQLLPDHGSFFEEEADLLHRSSGIGVSAVQFPLLQPIVAVKKLDLHEVNQQTSGAFRLDPWNASPGAVVVQVNFRDVLNKLPGFDDVLGEVCIPISTLVRDGEISGWFQVLEVGTTAFSPGEEAYEHLVTATASKTSDSDNPGKSHSTKERSENPQVYLQMRWYPPDPNAEVTETDKEASIVVAEEMSRSAMLQETKLDLIGSSIGAFNTVRGLGGNVQFIQNILGTILDVVEKIRNAFNFSDPFKSSVLLLVLTVLWLFLAIVPTRALVLVGGLAQYIATFVARYGPSSAGPTTDRSSKPATEDTKSNGVPIMTWLLNAFRALPTDEDLRRTYFWESRRFGERESEILAAKKREARLSRLWKAEWWANVDIKVDVDSTKGSSTSSSESREWEWDPIFAIVQGRRFLWWHSARDFDNGEAPRGRIFLAGHAGLAGLSPLDLRELHESEVPLVVNIFGRGVEGQQKLTILCEDSEVKEMLESAVLAASTKSD